MAAGGHTLELRALLYCVFDKDQGPTVFCSDPPGAVGSKFKPLGRYLLPESFATGRVVSLVLDDNVILGAPVYIEDTLYDRNCFQFNICAVISSQIVIEPYRDLAQHLASAFEALEVEIKLLSQPSAAERVTGVLQRLRRQLNAAGECFVRVDGSRCICFRVSPSRVLPKAPALSEVPVPRIDLQLLIGQPHHWASMDSDEDGSLGVLSHARLQKVMEGEAPVSGDDHDDDNNVSGEEIDSRDAVAAYHGGDGVSPKPPPLPFDLDLTCVRVAGLIDGYRTIRDVIEASGLAAHTVLLCVRHLVHFGLVALIEEITLESRYWLTPEFHCAFETAEVKDQVVRYATAGMRVDKDEATLHALHALYAGLDGWSQTLGEFQQAHEGELQERGVSLRHFIAFGMLFGFVQCIDRCTQALSEEEASELETLRSATIPRMKEELKATGLSISQVNKDETVRRLVIRLNELKAKEKNKPAYRLSGWNEGGSVPRQMSEGSSD